MRASGPLSVVGLLLLAGSLLTQAQETPADVAVPVLPAPAPPLTPKQAPIERRTPHPNATSAEPVSGPLTRPGAATQGPQEPAQKAGSGAAVGTLRVETRLVNVALNVVDAHGAPVGGFEKKDFQLFEDGRQQTIAVFEREATSPLSIVLAIDASETVLTSERLEREAAKRFVRAILREQDEIDLMDFSDTVREIVPFTNQARRVEQGLAQLERGDATALYNAVYLASERLGQRPAGANRRRVLVLISDGGDSVKGERYEDAVEEAQRAGAIIYAIIMVPIASDAGRNTGGEHALIQMTEDTGGKYYYVEDPADLEPAFRHVSEDLRTQYVLGYYAPGGGAADFRRIRVELTDGVAGYSLRYRTGYYADGK